MLPSLLACISTAVLTGAVNIPFLAPQAESNVVSPASNVWACDVRAWTRAPDLSPGLVTPAETRLAYNGTDCKDIVGWQVGLRFKERAIVKLKSADIQIPTQPRCGDHVAFMGRQDAEWNDVYSSGMYIPVGPSPYEIAMKEYNDALRNHSLWSVHGAERVAFDVMKELSLPESSVDHADIVRSFAIHVPKTNFPPVREVPDNRPMQTGDEMMQTETKFEYYHLLRLANGSTVDVSAGRTGFLPIPYDMQTKTSDTLRRQQVTTLKSPRAEAFDPEMFGGPGSKDNRSPECDKDNLATFSIRLEPLSEHSFQARNVTLNLTLSRTGNGTEIPAYLDVSRKIMTNVTYAWNYLSTQEEYDAVLDPKGRNRLMVSSSSERAQRILATRSEDNPLASSRRPHDGPYWYHGNTMTTRYEFDSKIPAETYNMVVNMTIDELDFPTFQTTFQDFFSSIDVRLGTTFSCLNLTSNETARQTYRSSLLTGLDAEWTEYRPERDVTEDGLRLRAYHYKPHMGTLMLHRPVTLSSRSIPLKEVKHYLDPGSTGPALSQQIADEVDFPLLSQTIRPEQSHELLKSRYHYKNRQLSYAEGPRNYGGASFHAAKLWQKKKSMEKGENIEPRF